MKFPFFTIIFLIFFASCSRKSIFKDEIRPFEGKIHFNYVNDSLDFSLSLFGGMKPVLNPKYKYIKKRLGTSSYQYNITNAQIKHKEDILLNNDNFGNDVFQLFQVYSIKHDINLEMFVHSYKKHTIHKNKNVWYLQDSIIKNNIDNTFFRSIKYSTKGDSSFTNIIESFFLKKGYLIRLLFIRKNQYECNTDALDYESYSIITSFENTNQYKTKPMLGANKLFLHTKFNYLTPLDKLINDDQNDPFKNELLGTYYSYLGDIKNALKFKTNSQNNNQNLPDTGDISKYSTVTAYELPYLIPDSCKVIMINEDHTNPYSRIFMLQLLKPLYEKGFRCFASETLNPSFNVNPYQELRQGSGFYISEPNYGNLLRTAMEIGYKIYSYENNEPYMQENGVGPTEFREYQQAKNLINILRNNKDSKLIVFAGHGHIKKTNLKGGKLMAQFFKKLSGITPFCVEQTAMTEGYESTNEHPYYTFIENKYKFKESIFLRYRNSLFVEPSLLNSVDVQVFHPRTVFDSNNFATWLLYKGKNVQKFSLTGSEYKNSIFQVFKSIEFESLSFDAIPLINLPLNGNNTFEIYLPSGNYSISVFDKYRNILYNKIISFK